MTHEKALRMGGGGAGCDFMKLGSLFDGIGGALLCAKLSGIEPVWASEIEPFPIKVTEHHFPEVKHLGDITKINGAEIEPVDIIVGGSPCQDLSVAGKRAGLDGARSGLFMDQIRIIKEMRNATSKQTGNGSDKIPRPRYMVWENVPGAFSSNEGEDFRAVLEETAKVADSTVSIPRSITGWANAGSILADRFSISWRTFDAQYWGVPQRRRRIYLVADFGGQSAPEILFESEGDKGTSLQTRDSGDILPMLKVQGGGLSLERLSHCVFDGKGIRWLTPLERERLQGFPDGYTNIPGASDSARYKALGNSFAIPNAYFVISNISNYKDALHCISRKDRGGWD